MERNDRVKVGNIKFDKGFNGSKCFSGIFFTDEMAELAGSEKVFEIVDLQFYTNGNVLAKLDNGMLFPISSLVKVGSES